MHLNTVFIVYLPLVALAYPFKPSSNSLPFSSTLPTLHPRDSITILVTNTLTNSTATSSQNNSKFEVVNNAKNAAIALGDNSTHEVDFDTFGDKNMLNSTGSNTGGWNTKNRDSELKTGRRKRDVSNGVDFKRAHEEVQERFESLMRDVLERSMERSSGDVCHGRVDDQECENAKLRAREKWHKLWYHGDCDRRDFNCHPRNETGKGHRLWYHGD